MPKTILVTRQSHPVPKRDPSVSRWNSPYAEPNANPDHKRFYELGYMDGLDGEHLRNLHTPCYMTESDFQAYESGWHTGNNEWFDDDD